MVEFEANVNVEWGCVYSMSVGDNDFGPLI